jgi:hypothetical protein
MHMSDEELLTLLRFCLGSLSNTVLPCSYRQLEAAARVHPGCVVLTCWSYPAYIRWLSCR